MFRFAWPALVALLSLTHLASAAPVPVGKEDKIVSLPVLATSMVVVQLNGLEQTRNRLTKLIEAAAPKESNELVKAIDKQLTTLLDGRDLKAIDKDGRVLLALGDFSKLGELSEAPLVLVLPVSDYKAFREKFLTAEERKSFTKGKDGIDSFDVESGNTVHAVEKAGTVTFTMSKDTAEKYAGKFDPLTVKQLGTLADTFLASDLGIYLNLSRVNDEYGQQIQLGKQLFNQAIQQGGTGLDKHQLEIAKVVYNGMFQAVEDGKGLVIALSLPPTGVALRIDMQFAPDSVSAKLMGGEKPAKLARIDDLPKGLTTYSAWSLGKGLTSAFAKLSREFHPAEDDDKALDLIASYTDLVTKADVDSIAASGEAGASLSVTTLPEPEKAVTGLLKVMKSLTAGASVSNVMLKAKPKLTENDQKYGGFQFHLAKLEMDFEASVKGVEDENVREATIESMKRLTPEKQNVWFGTDGKVFLRVTGKDWDTAKKLIDGYTAKAGKVGELAAFAATRKQLPTDSSSIMIVDVAAMLATASDYLSGMAGQIPGFPAAMPKLKKATGVDPAFLGVSFTARGDTIRLDVFAPADAVKVVRKSIDESK